MRHVLPGLLALAAPAVALAQPSDSVLARAPIRAWMGINAALLTDFSSGGAAGDYRFMIERLGGPSVGVALGVIGKDLDEAVIGSSTVGYAALLGGKSFALGDAAFANVNAGVGYGLGVDNDLCLIFREATCEDVRGVIVPARVEVHVAPFSRLSFGASFGGVLTSPIGSLIGVGLHVNVGHNLRGQQ